MATENFYRLTRPHTVFFEHARHKCEGEEIREDGDRVTLPVGALIRPTEAELVNLADRLEPQAFVPAPEAPKEEEVPDADDDILDALGAALDDVHGDWNALTVADLRGFATGLELGLDKKQSKAKVIEALQAVL